MPYWNRWVRRAARLLAAVDLTGFLDFHGRRAWNRCVIPFSVRALRRSTELLVQLPFCSMRKVCVAAFALVILNSATKALSPRVLPISPEESAMMKAKDEPGIDYTAQFAWLSKRQKEDYEALADRIPDPEGFSRVDVPSGSFPDWLRHLPVAATGTSVTTSNGKVILDGQHPNLAAVVQLQPRGARLLNSSNMMLRLRAEYCWASGKLDGVAFHFDSGQLSSFGAWSRGLRPVLEEQNIVFKQTKMTDAGRDSFCDYLETLFSFASAASLLDDTRPSEDRTLSAGDIFLRPGKGGGAIMVLDVATDADGQVRVLLGKGGEPAQTFHVLRNDDGEAWFPMAQTKPLQITGCGSFSNAKLRHWVQR